MIGKPSYWPGLGSSSIDNLKEINRETGGVLCLESSETT
jgi:hypothetical protein